MSQITNFESVCLKDPHSRGMISSIYSQISTNPGLEKPPYARKWEEDLEKSLDMADWSKIWTATKSSSPNILAVETNYKVLTRWYLVPSRLAKFAPTQAAQCFRGCSDPGTHMHIWWSCPTVQTFWGKIFEIASRMFELKLQPDPVIALLNLKPDCLTHNQFKLFTQLLTAAKQTIAKAWRSANLEIPETKHRLNTFMSHAKMLAIERDQIPIFEKTWNPWIKYHLSPIFDNSILKPW